MGNTARGRAAISKVTTDKMKTGKVSASTETPGTLATMIVHELLGIGHAALRLPHAFQLYAKDQPPAFHEKFVAAFTASKKQQKFRAGAEMAWNARKFHQATEEVQNSYHAKVAELKDAALARRAALTDQLNQKLPPKDAQKWALFSSIHEWRQIDISFSPG